VPGPQANLYCAGARLLAQYPVSAITDGMVLNITVMSYAGHLDIGIVADRAQMPDTADLIGWMEESLVELERCEPVLAVSPVRQSPGGGLHAKRKRELQTAMLNGVAEQ